MAKRNTKIRYEQLEDLSLDEILDGSIYGRIKLSDLTENQVNIIVKDQAYESLSQTVYDDGDVINNCYGTFYAGQSFIADKTGTLDSIQLRLTKTDGGTIDDLVVSVYNAGIDEFPTGVVLQSITVAKGTISSGASFVTANFTTVNVTAGNRYAFTVKQASDSGDSSNQYDLHGDNTVDSYSNGTAIYSLDSGSSWNIYTDDDAYFVITITGTPGEEIISLIENGTLKSDLTVDPSASIIGYRRVAGEVPSETPNGAITDFIIVTTPTSGTLEVLLNGLQQQVGGSKDYTVSGSTVTFGTAPEAGDIVIFNYNY